MANIAIKGLIGTMVFVIVAAVVVIALQLIMAAFNFTGTFATVLTLIFGGIVGLFIALLTLSKLAEQF